MTLTDLQEQELKYEDAKSGIQIFGSIFLFMLPVSITMFFIRVDYSWSIYAISTLAYAIVTLNFFRKYKKEKIKLIAAKV